MNRKQTVSMRGNNKDFESRTYDMYKQNEKESYQMDPKIIELKKKYQIDKTLQRCNTKANLKQQPPINHQQQVFRKLENIKSELQAIPGWQRHVKSILFQQLSFSKQNEQNTEISRHQQNCYSRMGPDSRKEENLLQNRFLTSSNLSFKINQTSSIERSDLKLKQVKDFSHQTPVKKIKQFELEKHKYTNKDHTFQSTQDQRKVDQKINEISRKIKQAQIKKKNLGVDFVPFDKKSTLFNVESEKVVYDNSLRSRTPQLACYDRIKQVNSIQKGYSKPPKPSKSISKINVPHQLPYKNVFDEISPRFAPIFENKKQIKRQHKARPVLSNLQQTQNKFQLQKELLLNKDKKIRTYSNFGASQTLTHTNEQIESRKLGQDQIKNKPSYYQRFDQPVNERKKKYHEQQKNKKKQITAKLVQAFCQQVKLDEKFRNGKLWLKSSKNEKKYERLRSLLQMEGFSLPTEKIIQQFQVLQKQDNPFFSVTSQSCDLQQVAKSYIECQKYWKKNLFKKFNREGLESEDFSSLTIDLEKKGFISLEDLVRFLNMETGTFFRNRDLFTIFRRLSSNGQKLTFNSFINFFCS